MSIEDLLGDAIDGDSMWTELSDKYIRIYYKDKLIACFVSNPNLSQISVIKTLIDISVTKITEGMDGEEITNQLEEEGIEEPPTIKRVMSSIKVPNDIDLDKVTERNLYTGEEIR